MPSAPPFEPLVDLGEDFDPPMSGSWIEGRRSTLRRLRLAVPLIALLLLVTAAQSPPVGPLRLDARVPVGIDVSAMIEGSTLYVYQIAGGHNGIRAYDLDRGGLLWSAATLELATETDMLYADGQVIVSMADTDASGEHTVAFDARTGRRLWADDLGYATIASGGVLVESAPRPPGFNFVGTVRTASFRLLDPRTGQTRWTLDLPDNCVTNLVQPAVGPADGLVELCSNSSRLSVVDLATGRVAASRNVDLGNPADNFYLPPPDQMREPQLVTIGDTVLVAHANAPMPTIDAYAATDLHRVWSGLPVVSGQDLAECGSSLCVFDGTSSGSVVDLLTGSQIGLVPPRGTAGPPDGSLVLLPVGDGGTATGTVTVPMTDPGVSVSLSLSRETGSVDVATWLAVWHTSGPPHGRAGLGGQATVSGRPTLLGALRGVAPPSVLDSSCTQVTGYLACATDAALSVWKLPEG